MLPTATLSFIESFPFSIPCLKLRIFCRIYSLPPLRNNPCWLGQPVRCIQIFGSFPLFALTWMPNQPSWCIWVVTIYLMIGSVWFQLLIYFNSKLSIACLPQLLEAAVLQPDINQASRAHAAGASRLIWARKFSFSWASLCTALNLGYRSAAKLLSSTKLLCIYQQANIFTLQIPLQIMVVQSAHFSANLDKYVNITVNIITIVIRSS